MIRIGFWGGESKDGQHGCNYMIGHVTDQDGDDQELYAEAIYDSEDENVDEMYGYDELKKEIINQAAEYGIPENELDFQ